METTKNDTSNLVIDNYSNHSGLENEVDTENNIIIGNLDNEVKCIEMHTPVTNSRTNLTVDGHGTDCGKVASSDQSPTGIIIDNCDIVTRDNHVTNSDDVTIDDIARNNNINVDVDVMHSDHVTNGNHSTNGDIVINNHMTNPDLATHGNHVIVDSVSVREHTDAVPRKQSSAMLRELDSNELHNTMEELRIRLVQLKKDRISIRDRKQQTSSETDQEFLEAEFDRLNRECTKVTDEISYLESLQQPDANEEKSGKIH